MKHTPWSRRIPLLALLVIPQPLLAQRASENAVASADDAFGSAVGNETTGIYTENETRGFNPLKAGNGRIDGIYFDPINPLSYRFRAITAIRVGIAALDFPFQAPTGIADYRLRSFPDKLGASISHTFNPFGGLFDEFEVRAPIVPGKVALTGGVTYGEFENSDASDSRNFGWGIRPIFRFANSAEISPYIQRTRFSSFRNHPLTVVSDFIPRFPGKRVDLVQKWAAKRYDNNHSAIVFKTPITENLSLRGGLFHLSGSSDENYSEIYSIVDRTELANHRLIADPRHSIKSTSGEVQAAFRFGNARWRHRIIAGFRGRNRITENGGSDSRNFGQTLYGTPDPEPKPDFSFGQPNHGRIKQSALLFGYIGKIEDRASINLGLQKARYRARSRDGRTGLISASRNDPWLYNASLGVPLSESFSVYIGTQRGLEDSGTAPENAVNRNAQLPATRSTQHEGGLRLKFADGQLVLSTFQIRKPYFAFDAANVFTPVGTVQHRGIEASVAGQFGPRASIVAGAVAIQARVSGPARDLGLVGKRPAGVPSLYARLDANYRTDILGGLTPIVAVVYTGKRAVGAQPLASLSGRQLALPGFLTVDLGLRQTFTIGGTPASYRLLVSNIFDKESWKVVAPNTIYSDERRRVLLAVTVDI